MREYVGKYHPQSITSVGFGFSEKIGLKLLNKVKLTLSRKLNFTGNGMIF